MLRCVSLALTVLSAVCAPDVTRAQTVPPPLVPFEDLARAPQFYAPAVDPSGDRVAILETVDGRGEITVRDLNTKKSERIYRDPVRSIQNVTWSADGRWLLFLQDAGGDEGYHLYRLSASKKESAATDLTPFKASEAALVRLPQNDPGAAIVTINKRDPEFPDVFRIEIASGQMRELVRNIDRFTDFAADANGRILAATKITDAGTIELWTRPGVSAGWKRVYSAPASERFAMQQLSADGSAIFIRSNRGLEAERLFRIDLRSSALVKVPGRTAGSSMTNG